MFKSILTLVLVSSFFSSLLYAQPASIGSEFVVEKPLPTALDEAKLQYLKNSSKIDSPLTLRDPFKRILRSSQKDGNRDTKISAFGREGTFSNLPSIDGIPLSQIKIIGVLLGPERRAIARRLEAGDKLSKESYMLKEGMKLGSEQAEIKAILPGGIVLVEKIKNVYDQDEYLETVVPIYK